LRGFATGSAECCVCPVCRAIAAAREPNPEFAERLATGAADLATGLAGVLRAFSRAAQTRAPGVGRGSAESDPWRAATRGEAAATSTAGGAEPGTAAGEPAAAPGAAEPAAPPIPPKASPAPKPMAKKAVRPKVAPPTAPAPASPDVPGADAEE
jgi:hypothetical protein